MTTDVLLALIDPDPDQPRKHFDPVALGELAESMRANGLAVPILLRPAGGRYIIVHGERRYRAAQSLGWPAIPAEVRELSADEARWLALVENVQRADLSPIEEAREYQQRLADGGMTQEELGKRIGKGRSYIAQKLRLLTLPPPLVYYLERGAITEGHARQLLRLRAVFTPDLQHDFGYHDDADFHETLPECWGVLGAVLLDMIAPFEYPPIWFRWALGEEPFGMEIRPYFCTPYGRDLEAEGERMARVFNTTVAGACRECGRYLYEAKGVIPQWEIAAFWWASVATVFDMSVADLNYHITDFEHMFLSWLALWPLYCKDKQLAKTLKSAYEGKGPGGALYADIAACHAGELAADKTFTARALKAIGGEDAPVAWPSRYVWGPEGVSRDTH